MKETALEVNPTCHLVLTEYDVLPPEMSLDYTEHCPISGGSDSYTSTDISKEKAQEIINFLAAFVADHDDGKSVCHACDGTGLVDRGY